MMPRCLIDAASSSSSASEKLRRGLRGLGLRYSIGTRRWVRARSGVVVASALTSPMSAARPRPSRDRPSSAIAMSPNLPTSRCAVLLIRFDLTRFDRSVRARCVRYQFLLALNDLGREPQIGFAADAFEIVDQHRLAVGWRLRHPHIARDDGVVDFLFAVRAH